MMRAANVMTSVNPLTRPVLQHIDPDRRGFELAQRLADQQLGALLTARRNGGAAKQDYCGRQLLGRRNDRRRVMPVEGVDLRRTLFVDDSHAVLHAALAAGVAWLYQVLQPDSTQPPHAPLADVPGIRRLADLGESLRTQVSDAVSAPVEGVVRSAP